MSDFIHGLLQLVLATTFLYASGPRVTHAAPDGADLKSACQRSLANGFDGIDGRMCTWYVTPCDCDINQAADISPICLPYDATTGMLARIVIDGIADSPELQKRGAAEAAAVVLSKEFPCSGRQMDSK